MPTSTARKTDAVDSTSDAALTHVFSHLRLWLVAGVFLWLDLWSKRWVFENLPDDRAEPFLSGVIELRRSLNAGAVFGSLSGQVSLFMVASLFALGFVIYLFVSSSRRQIVLHIALGLVLAGALGNLYDRALMKADIVTYKTPSGEKRMVIGEIIHDDEEGDGSKSRLIRIGRWREPDRATAQVFTRSEVTIWQQGVVRDFIRFVPKFPTWVPKLGGRDVWPWIFNIADAALVCGVGALLCTSWSGRRPHEED